MNRECKTLKTSRLKIGKKAAAPTKKGLHGVVRHLPGKSAPASKKKAPASKTGKIVAPTYRVSINLQTKDATVTARDVEARLTAHCKRGQVAEFGYLGGREGTARAITVARGDAGAFTASFDIRLDDRRAVLSKADCAGPFKDKIAKELGTLLRRRHDGTLSVKR